MLEVPPEVLFEVLDVPATAEKMGAKVDWVDKVLGEIAKKKEHHSLLQGRRSYRTNSSNWIAKEKR